MGGPRLVPDASERSNARTFCGEVPWRLISALARGEEVSACYIVRDARRQEAKNGKDYLRLQLADGTGVIDAMVWEDVDRWEPICAVDAIVGVRAKVGSYQDRLQLSITLVEPLRPEAEEMEHLLQASPRPREAMEKELDRIISSIVDPGLLKLVKRCLGRGTESGRAFRVHPAAKRNHHAYLCGLLEHTLSVVQIADKLGRHYVGQGFEVDRDLLVAGALLHDLGKVRELKSLPASGYTNEGQLLGHIVLGIQIVERESAGIQELDPDRLLLQLQAYAACGDDAGIQTAVRRNYARLVELARELSGTDDERIDGFFQMGMWCNVAAALGIPDFSVDSGWVQESLRSDG